MWSLVCVWKWTSLVQELNAGGGGPSPPPDASAVDSVADRRWLLRPLTPAWGRFPSLVCVLRGLGSPALPAAEAHCRRLCLLCPLL